MKIKSFALTMATAALTIAVALPVTMVTTTDAEAKSYGRSSSSSFSRSSYRSSSKSSFSSSSKSSGRSSKSLFSSWGGSKSKAKPTSKPKSFKTASASKPSGKKQFKTSKGVSGKKFGKTNTSKGFKPKSNQTFRSKQALNAQRNKFKKPVNTGVGRSSATPRQRQTATNTTYRNKYSGNSTYDRASRYDRGTYLGRRNNYYSSYNTPSYVYLGSPSYGMWDSLFLYSMMSNMNNHNASQFAYNHQNDADYRAWRREANSLSKDNAELRKQLAQIDAGQAQYAGQKIDPNYIPKGVDADIAMSQEVLNAQKPILNLGVASAGGTYARVVKAYNRGINDVTINFIPTAGTGEILECISTGRCDGGMVQGDGYWNFIENKQTYELPFERAFSTHDEGVHLFCHEDGYSSASDMDKNTKLWFPNGSGAAETFKNWMAENSDYEKVKTVLNTPLMKVGSNKEAVMKITNDKNACAMIVTAQGASKDINDIEKIAKQLKVVLVNITDGDLNDTEDPSGNDVYRVGDMDAYKNLNRQAAVFGMMSGDVDTLFVKADLLIGSKWKKANSKIYADMLMKMMAMQPTIDNLTKPAKS